DGSALPKTGKKRKAGRRDSNLFGWTHGVGVCVCVCLCVCVCVCVCVSVCLCVCMCVCVCVTEPECVCMMGSHLSVCMLCQGECVCACQGKHTVLCVFRSCVIVSRCVTVICYAVLCRCMCMSVCVCVCVCVYVFQLRGSMPCVLLAEQGRGRNLIVFKPHIGTHAQRELSRATR